MVVHLYSGEVREKLKLFIAVIAIVSTIVLADSTKLIGNMNNTRPEVSRIAELEIRLGGGREPRPHAVWVTVEADGRVFERSKARKVDPKSVTQLLDFLSISELCNIDQESFDKALREAGEFNKSLRGGTGIYTISFTCNGYLHSLSLNRPSLYADSAVPEARNFSTIIALVKQLVKQGISDI